MVGLLVLPDNGLVGGGAWYWFDDHIVVLLLLQSRVGQLEARRGRGRREEEKGVCKERGGRRGRSGRSGKERKVNVKDRIVHTGQGCSKLCSWIVN